MLMGIFSSFFLIFSNEGEGGLGCAGTTDLSGNWHASVFHSSNAWPACATRWGTGFGFGHPRRPQSVLLPERHDASGCCHSQAQCAAA